MYINTELLVLAIIWTFGIVQTNPVENAMKMFNKTNSQVSKVLQEEIDRIEAKVTAISNLESKLFKLKIIAADAKNKSQAESLYNQANGLELVEEQFDATAEKLFGVLKSIRTQKGTTMVKYGKVKNTLKSIQDLEAMIMKKNLPLPSLIVQDAPKQPVTSTKLSA